MEFGWLAFPALWICDHRLHDRTNQGYVSKAPLIPKLSRQIVDKCRSRRGMSCARTRDPEEPSD
jgi:hypothetical protein